MLFGATTLKSDNLLPALAAFGLAASSATAAAPVDLTADLVVRSDGASLPRFMGSLGGAKITGNLAWRPPVASTDAAPLDPDVALAQSIAGEAPAASPAQISGEVSLDRASASALFALPLGLAPSQGRGRVGPTRNSHLHSSRRRLRISASKSVRLTSAKARLPAIFPRAFG